MAKDYISVEQDNFDDNEDDIYMDKYHSRNDFSSMAIDLFFNLNIKIALFLYIFCLFLFSDIFIHNFLSKIPNTVNNLGYPTTNGTMMQILILVIFYLIIDILISKKYI